MREEFSILKCFLLLLQLQSDNDVTSWETIDIGAVEDPVVTLEEVFAYLEVSEKPCMVALDEFQQIAEFRAVGRQGAVGQGRRLAHGRALPHRRLLLRRVAAGELLNKQGPCHSSRNRPSAVTCLLHDNKVHRKPDPDTLDETLRMIIIHNYLINKNKKALYSRAL